MRRGAIGPPQPGIRGRITNVPTGQRIYDAGRERRLCRDRTRAHVFAEGHPGFPVLRSVVTSQLGRPRWCTSRWLGAIEAEATREETRDSDCGTEDSSARIARYPTANAGEGKAETLRFRATHALIRNR